MTSPTTDHFEEAPLTMHNWVLGRWDFKFVKLSFHKSDLGRPRHNRDSEDNVLPWW